MMTEASNIALSGTDLSTRNLSNRDLPLRISPPLLAAPARTLRTKALSASFELLFTRSAERPRVERYIAEQFQAAYGASIQEFMPHLLTMQRRGQLGAAVGLRSTHHQTLFLERYFSSPVEQVIYEATGQAVNGAPVIEIGNLAGTRRGSSELLFTILIATLYQAGFEWLTFTATPAVEKSLRRMGITLYTLGHASSHTLSDTEKSNWGSYYDCQPRIVAGRASSGIVALNNSRPLAALLFQYQDRINTLAAELKVSLSDGQHSFAA